MALFINGVWRHRFKDDGIRAPLGACDRTCTARFSNGWSCCPGSEFLTTTQHRPRHFDGHRPRCLDNGLGTIPDAGMPLGGGIPIVTPTPSQVAAVPDIPADETGTGHSPC